MPRRLKKLNLKKNRKRVIKAVIHIRASLHNTIVTITDIRGEVLCWSSAGASGFKAKKKSSPFAAQITTENALRLVFDQGLKQAEVMVNGPGKGRETALRAIINSGIAVGLVRDVTPIPHNGCRSPKKRRV